jgi:hypothetical protein
MNLSMFFVGVSFLLAMSINVTPATAAPDLLAADQAVFRTKTARFAVSVGTPVGPKGNNGVGNGVDPQPPGNPPINDAPGTGPGNPGKQGGPKP